MTSTFGGLQQAGTALAAARYGLNVVSQNIANADTPGYVRRAAQQASLDGVEGVSRRYVAATQTGGVQILGTSRLNDALVDARARLEDARGAAADTTASRLSSVEAVFPEPSDTGLSEQLNAFWNAWSAVANDPSSAATRTTLLSKAQTVASTLNSMSTSLSGIAANIGQSLGQTATAANALASKLADLNARIAVAAGGGSDTSDLLDQRDQVLDQLSASLGATATLQPNGMVNVTVGGQALVTGNTAATVAFDGANITVGGTVATLTTGSAAADVTALGTTLPGYQSALDGVAAKLITVVNTAQANGTDLAGDTGTPMFSGAGAGDIAVAFTDPTLVAAAAAGAGALDGSNATGLGTAGNLSSGPDAAYVQLVASVAGDSAVAQQQQATQASVTQSADALRTSANGVSYDDEINNMLTYQHAYQAASRVLTTIDSMLDTLINHTGLGN
ncbi:MAG: flagellar hook-associated protein FlgK [Jatrophihabitans sp.]|uniref:flagellar hook-associated protein FlgK n=1 Tax=Jatrophihabitans sp. TaxID=1932789 RepID=UPI003F7DA5A8